MSSSERESELREDIAPGLSFTVRLVFKIFGEASSSES